MIYLLDTSACIDALRSPGRVRTRIQAAAGDCAISLITVIELRVGASAGRSPQRALAALDDFLTPFATLTIDRHCVDAAVATKLQLRSVGQPIGDFDLLIAATALAHELTVVTNDRDSLRIPGLQVEDWTA